MLCNGRLIGSAARGCTPSGTAPSRRFGAAKNLGPPLLPFHGRVSEGWRRAGLGKPHPGLETKHPFVIWQGRASNRLARKEPLRRTHGTSFGEVPQEALDIRREVSAMSPWGTHPGLYFNTSVDRRKLVVRLRLRRRSAVCTVAKLMRSCVAGNDDHPEGAIRELKAERDSEIKIAGPGLAKSLTELGLVQSDQAVIRLIYVPA